MSWGRIGHPTEMVAIDQEIEVMVLHIDREKEKIALGLKQKSASPWDNVVDKYPVGTHAQGHGRQRDELRRLREARRRASKAWCTSARCRGPSAINHPSELVQIGDEIDVVILGIDKEKQEISLGMKQTQENPWDKVAETYPVGHDGQRQGPQPHQLRRVHRDRRRASTACCTSATCRGPARSATPAKCSKRARRSSARCSRSIRSAAASPWASSSWTTIRGPPTSPTKYQPGQVVTGTVTKITNFGVFVGLEDGLEGLLHISELADHKVENPEDVVKVGDEIEVKILRVDTDERKIGLSRKRVEWAEDDGVEPPAEAAAATARRQGEEVPRRAEGRPGRRRPADLDRKDVGQVGQASCLP